MQATLICRDFYRAITAISARWSRLLLLPVLALLLGQLVGGVVRAEIDPVVMGRPSIRIFTSRDGLPRSTITSIARDRKQYIWVGTADGAAYYNGREWTTVNMPNRALSNYITAILAASDGSIWFGTQSGGIARWQDQQWTRFDRDNGLTNNWVTTLIETRDNNGGSIIWAGTFGGGLARYQQQRWTSYDTEAGLPGNLVTSLLATHAADGSETLWAGTQAGLARRVGERWQAVEIDNLANAVVTSLVETVTGGQPRLWVGTERGLAAFTAGSWELFQQLPDNRVTSLVETTGSDGASVLIVGTYGGGVVRYQHDQWMVFDKRLGLPDNVVLSLFATDRGSASQILWIGTEIGLVRLDQGHWTTFNNSAGLPDNIVASLLETEIDGAHAVWIGTRLGLARLHNGRWTIYNTDSGLPDNRISSLLETIDKEGNSAIWVGTFGGGLACLKQQRWSYYQLADGLPSNLITSLLETTVNGEPALLVGTLAGLAQISLTPNSSRVVKKFDNRELPDFHITSLLDCVVDGKHTLWVGTVKGLACRRDDKWQHFDRSDGLPSDRIYSLLATTAFNGQSILLAGTANGVAQCNLTTGQWRNFAEVAQVTLPNNVTYQIREDRSKRIYLFTNHGVARLTPQTTKTQNSADNQSDNQVAYQLYNFTIEDGLPSNECNSGASMVDHSGRIWAGTTEGAAMFDPVDEQEDHLAKPLHIERVILNGREQPLLPIKLGYRENNFTFEYALLSYLHERDTRYQTQLVNLDREPSSWSSSYRRDYTTLPAGDYIFRVWGKDYAGNISGPAEFAFQIPPAPWFRWWAYLCYLGIMTIIIYGIVQWRLQNLKHRNEMLAEKIRERTAELDETVAQLRHSEKRALASEQHALDASRAKSTFLATMSHELRTPLNAILGFTQLLKRDQKTHADQHEYLEIILRSGEHLLSMINDVLSISKIEAGRLALNQTSFDLKRLLIELTEMFQVRAETKQLQLLSEIAPGLPTAVSGDEGKLRQVLINLLGNAVKFTERGGLTLRADWRDDVATFEVEDTGYGISPAEMTKLFEPFQQTESGARSNEGTGLGLAISRDFVRLMGGEITVKSELGRGTRFTFQIRLPRATIESVVEKKGRVVALAAGEPDYRILIADDRWENRIILTKLLQSIGLDVREATNGVEVVEIWQSWQPHLIWLDIRMPVLDGYQAAKQIRDYQAKSPTATPTVIIALTASAFEHEHDAIMAAGCNDLVTKPFREETILEKMSEHLGIRYLYQAEDARAADAAQLTPEILARLSLLPGDLMMMLNNTLIRGDILATNAVIEKIREHDQPLAEKLSTMVDDFQFEEIIKAMES